MTNFAYQEMKTHLGLKLLLIFFVGLSSIFACGVSQTTNPADAAVMLALKKSLNPPEDLGWSDPDPCKWNHVVCSDDKRVTRIQIGHQNLQGTLPPNISNLTELERLEVQWNNISGPLPSFNGLSSLQVLMIGNNQFSSIPIDFFSGMSSLQSVDIDNNPFSAWEIPKSLRNASALQNFSANSANITGKIPDFFGPDDFPGLINLHLAFNNLEGQLPDSFSGSQLESFWVNGQKSNGKLIGGIDVIQNMTFLKEVWLHSNTFSGPLPGFSGLKGLERLNLRDNSFTGPVPVSLVHLGSLKIVNLTNNLLQGPMPKFNDSVAVDMNNNTNSFCLPEPGDCDPKVNTLLSIVKSMSYPVKFAENWKGNDPCADWFGITCNSGNITIVNFQKVGLTGTISPEFASLKSLQRLVLADNNLTGMIPEELTKLPVLAELDLTNNNLHGKVPAFKSNVTINANGNPNIEKEKSDSSASGPPSGVLWNSSTNAGSENNSSAEIGEKSRNWIGVLVFSILGGLFVIFLIGLAAFCLYKSKQKKFGRVQSPNAMVVHPHHLGSDNESVKITVAGSSVSVVQFLGLFGIYVESYKIIFSWRKIFSQITLALILPLSFIFLAHLEVSEVLFHKILHNEFQLERTQEGTKTYNNISDHISSEWTAFWLFKFVYFTFLLIFSLLSTAAVVHTIACIYTAREVTFRKVMSVVPKVWKRLMVTFLCTFAAFFLYNLAAVLTIFLWFFTVAFTRAGSVIFIVIMIFYAVGFVYMTIVWQLASVVSVLEEVCGLRAMMKSKELIKGKIWIAIVVFVKLNISLGAIQILFEKLVVHPDLSLVGRVGFGILCFLLLFKLFLFGLVIQTVIYFVCKSYHHENIDKSTLSDHLEVYLGEYVPLKTKDVQLEQFDV